MKKKGIQKAIAHQFCVEEERVKVEFTHSIDEDFFFEVNVNHNDGKQKNMK